MYVLPYRHQVKQKLHCDEIKHWNNDPCLPIHSQPKERISTTDAVNIILDEDLPRNKVCTKTPTLVSINCLFVVNWEKLKNPKDLACDDMGSWRLNKTYRSTFSICTNTVVFSKHSKRAEGSYTLIRRYYFNKSSPDVCKTMCTVQGE